MKINTIIITILALAAGQTLSAQGSIKEALAAIEAHNPSLRESARELELQKQENRSEALLEDPEVEFNYLWGQNAQVGMRHDLSVTQSFDIPTLAGMRSRQVSGLDAQAGLRYKADRLDVLLEASQVCIDIVYLNRLIDALGPHCAYAEKLSRVTERKMELGEADVMEVNKARLHLASVKSRLSRLEVERDGLLSQLRTLNGGEDLGLTTLSYGEDVIPADFRSWYEEAASRNPVLRYVEKEVELSTSGLRIEKTSTLPSLTVGYMSEIGVDEKFRGVTLGVSIPLWRNSNRIRQSRARVELARERQSRAEQEFYDRLLNNYEQACSLKELSDTHMEALEKNDNREYLISAQSLGEISMIDYIVETDLYYEFLEECLSAERDYRKALTELNAVNL